MVNSFLASGLLYLLGVAIGSALHGWMVLNRRQGEVPVRALTDPQKSPFERSKLLGFIAVLTRL
jgi:hypothetical protein